MDLCSSYQKGHDATMADLPIVTIFPGPGEDTFRVRTLEPDCQPQTRGWFSRWDSAVEFIRDHCQLNEPCTPDEFRDAFRQCRQGRQR